MRDKWQVLRVVTGIFFLISAVLFTIFGPPWRNKTILVLLLGFLGLFYVVSSLALKRIFRKMGEE
jgi:uncharacterized membrane protein